MHLVDKGEAWHYTHTNNANKKYKQTPLIYFGNFTYSEKNISDK